jgi:hypothetical protein
MPALLEYLSEQAWKKARGRNGTAADLTPTDGGKKDEGGSLHAGPWEPAVRALVEFRRLGDDWDGQGARALSAELLASAIGLAYLLYERGTEPPSRVVPGPEGSAVFEWQFPDGAYAEIEVVRPFYAEVMLLRPGQPAKHWTLPTE